MRNEENEHDDEILCEFGDIGLDVPNIDTSLIDFIAADEVEQTRYTKPKVIKDASYQVMYENAIQLAKDIHISEGLRVDALVSGNFVFGDFIEAFLTTKKARAKEMTISTLSLNQNNIDSLAALMRNNYIGKLNLVISVYFWGNERHSLIPYIYEELDEKISEGGGGRFQLAVADIHTKTVHFNTEGGKKIVIHGSANLRSSGNIEQFTIEENKYLYDFYDEKFKQLIKKYATINHAIRSKNVYDVMSRKVFK